MSSCFVPIKEKFFPMQALGPEEKGKKQKGFASASRSAHLAGLKVKGSGHEVGL
jgi:hypothetical protein